jgi:RND family efflux transporter MFP subunit
MSKQGIIPAGFVLLAAGLPALVGCRGQEAPPPPDVVRPVKVATVGESNMARVTFPGQVQAADRASLSFRVAGSLLELPVEEGEEAARGDLLARLDPIDFQIAVAEAQAAFDKAEADYHRHQRLYEKDAVPQSELELRRAQRDIARARLDQAKTNHSYTYLRAPYGGFIGRKLVENFEYVKAQQVIVTLQGVQIVEVVIDVAEAIVATVRADDEFDKFAIFDAAPGRRYPLSFKEVTAQADAVTQTFQVTFAMPQPDDLAILPGMTATVLVDASAVDAEDIPLTVPAAAVFNDDAGVSKVWVVDLDARTVHQRAVELGPVTGEDAVFVVDGLTAGETIAVAAVHRLEEGEKIQPVDRILH